MTSARRFTWSSRFFEFYPLLFRSDRFNIASFVWLAMLFVLTFADYLTRLWQIY
jgi:hypothetical protein